MIRITEKDFSPDFEMKRLRSPKNGGLCMFIGTVRREKDLKGIEIESYRGMAKRKLQEIEKMVAQRFQVEKIRIVHRTGSLHVGDNILFIGVSAAHRRDAFGACSLILEEIKRIVPIWKKEVFEDKERWVI